jgi:hypothetical protein
MTLRLRLFLLALACAASALPAHGQIGVGIEIKRRLHLRYEPILATVRIQNLSGRDLMLHDEEMPWFGFDISGGDGNLIVAPRNPDYKLDPLEIKIGETVKRTVDLTKLYGMSELGMHRIKATVFAKPLNKLFASQADLIDISEGKTLWERTVGVPDTLPNGGHTHTIKLIEFQDDKRYLYARVEDTERGIVFCTRKLGHMIDGTTPQMEFDTTNNLYILHLVAPKTYLLSNVGVNGEFLGQYTYETAKARPTFRRLADGTVQLVGARRQAATAKAGTDAAGVPHPKLSERPPGLPKE